MTDYILAASQISNVFWRACSGGWFFFTSSKPQGCKRGHKPALLPFIYFWFYERHSCAVSFPHTESLLLPPESNDLYRKKSLIQRCRKDKQLVNTATSWKIKIVSLFCSHIPLSSVIVHTVCGLASVQ